MFRAVFDRGPRIGDPACIWHESGRSVSVRGYADGTRVVRPAPEPAELAAGALRRPGAMMGPAPQASSEPGGTARWP